MSDFENGARSGSLTVKLGRGERMCLIGMDVADPEHDFVGFSIEVKSPGASRYVALRNRLNFDYSSQSPGVDGFRNYPSTEAPFQKFRWIHFPYDPKDGEYLYRVTKLHMGAAGDLVPGDQVTDLPIALDQAVYSDVLQVGFTRNFASSQAYRDKFGAGTGIIPAHADQGLTFQKVPGDVYRWLGFEAYALIFDVLNEVRNDAHLTLDVLAFELNEPDILAALVACGHRVRAVINDSGEYGLTTSAESKAAAQLRGSAGDDHVVRMHFETLQHNKVLIVRRDGDPVKVLFGSTNFTFRGLYIQANNALVSHSPEAVELFQQAFDLAFRGGDDFAGSDLARQWHAIDGAPAASFCFAPHVSCGVSLDQVGAAIDGATSSVFFAIAFLNQTTHGAVHDAIDRLADRPLFSYGISDQDDKLQITKPDGSPGIVDFAYLSSKAPEPFKSEWSGGNGIHQHDKFVVTDFNLPTAKVFTGSSNLSPSGEEGNGDNLVMIQDQRVATSYAIDAVRIFDHLQFRAAMQQSGAPQRLTLATPPAQDASAWFERYYVPGSQLEQDRLVFSALQPSAVAHR